MPQPLIPNSHTLPIVPAWSLTVYPTDDASSVRGVKLELLGLVEFFIHGSGVVCGGFLSVAALVAQQ